MGCTFFYYIHNNKRREPFFIMPGTANKKNYYEISMLATKEVLTKTFDEIADCSYWRWLGLSTKHF